MPTIKDVAAEAGVTSTTVSRVLNNRGYISEETREKVYSAMEKLNYMPNEMARNLSRQKSAIRNAARHWRTCLVMVTNASIGEASACT